MAESITRVEYWNTKKLCEVFNTGGAEIVRLEYETLSKPNKPVLGFQKNHIPWNKGKVNCYSEETLELMRESGKRKDISKAVEASAKKRRGNPAYNKGHTYPHFQKEGKIISKEGEIVEFDCISHISKELNLNPSHLGQVLSGKRKSHKGWKNAS